MAHSAGGVEDRSEAKPYVKAVNRFAFYARDADESFYAGQIRFGYRTQAETADDSVLVAKFNDVGNCAHRGEDCGVDEKLLQMLRSGGGAFDSIDDCPGEFEGDCRAGT